MVLFPLVNEVSESNGIMSVFSGVLVMDISYQRELNLLVSSGLKVDDAGVMLSAWTGFITLISSATEDKG